MKKETLEEAIKYYAHNNFDMHNTNNYKALEKGFEAGVKWQQERSYSEEEVKTAFLDGWQLRDGDLPFSKAMKKWFEQFKKK
jgi:hypothetical protein